MTRLLPCPPPKGTPCHCAQLSLRSGEDPQLLETYYISGAENDVCHPENTIPSYKEFVPSAPGDVVPT